MKNQNHQHRVLRGGIHTVSITSNDIPKRITDPLRRCGINPHSNSEIADQDQSYNSKVNPNHYGGEIRSLQDFNRTMTSIQGELGIRSFKYTRVDFSLDNFVPESYDCYLKLNKWIIQMLAMDHDTKSLYQAFDPMTFQNLTIRMDAEYFQAEFYNKNIESNGKSPVHSRLELRSKRMTKTNRGVLGELNLWCKRLRALPKWNKDFHDICNKLLHDRWKIESASGEVKNKAEFIRKYQGNIFTDQQLIDFCKLLGSTEKYARELKYRHGLETYTVSDLEEYIEQIAEEIIKYTAEDSNP